MIDETKRLSNIDLDVLRQGDIVFFKPIYRFNIRRPLDLFISKIIQISSPNYIHVGMIINDPKLGFIKILSAEWNGVQIRDLNNCNCYEFKRVKAHVNDLRKALVNGLQDFFDKDYGYFTALRAGVLRKLGLRSLYEHYALPTCSSLVCDILKSININVVPHLTSLDTLPDDIYNSSELICLNID